MRVDSPQVVHTRYIDVARGAPSRQLGGAMHPSRPIMSKPPPKPPMTCTMPLGGGRTHGHGAGPDIDVLIEPEPTPWRPLTASSAQLSSWRQCQSRKWPEHRPRSGLLAFAGCHLSEVLGSSRTHFEPGVVCITIEDCYFSSPALDNTPMLRFLTPVGSTFGYGPHRAGCQGDRDPVRWEELRLADLYQHLRRWLGLESAGRQRLR